MCTDVQGGPGAPWSLPRALHKEQARQPHVRMHCLQVYGTASEDMDSLTFATPKLIRNLMKPATQSVPINEYDYDKAGLPGAACAPCHSVRFSADCLTGARAPLSHATVQVLEGLKLTSDQFVDLCILCGCDYLGTIKGVCPGEHACHIGLAKLQVHRLMPSRYAPGIGGVRALTLIQKHGTLEKVLASLDPGKYDVPDPFPYEEARRMFKGAPAHCSAMQGKRPCPAERGYSVHQHTLWVAGVCCTLLKSGAQAGGDGAAVPAAQQLCTVCGSA